MMSKTERYQKGVINGSDEAIRCLQTEDQA